MPVWPQPPRRDAPPAFDRRRATRVALPASQRWRGKLVGAAPLAVAVHDFCATGLQLVAHSHAHVLAVGTQVVAQLHVPALQAPIELPLEVRRVALQASQLGPVASYGMAVTNFVPHTQALWTHALMHHAGRLGHDVSPKALARQGFVVCAPARALRYTTVRTPDALAAVMHLRHACYAEMQLLPRGSDQLQHMTDAWDARGQVLAAWLGSELVATTRVFAPQPHDALAIDGWLRVREGLPPLGQMVEVARLAVARAFRGHDVLAALCQLMARHALQRGRRYMILGTNHALAHYYDRYGALATGHVGTYCGAPAKIMLIDLLRVWRSGRSVARHAMFAEPPPLDGAPVRLPTGLPTLLRQLGHHAP